MILANIGFLLILVIISIIIMILDEDDSPTYVTKEYDFKIIDDACNHRFQMQVWNLVNQRIKENRDEKDIS